MQGKTFKCGHCGRPVISGIIFHNDIPYHYECTQSPYKNQQTWYGPQPTFGPLPHKEPIIDKALQEKLAEFFTKNMKKSDETIKPK